MLVKGSPFKSNAYAAASIGLNRTTRIVVRYLDTGKSYQERYEFTTKAKLIFPHPNKIFICVYLFP